MIWRRMLSLILLISFCFVSTAYAGTWVDDGIYIFDEGEESSVFMMTQEDIRREHVLEDHTYRASKHTFNYIVYRPSGTRPLENLPLIVVMHGSGEVGNDIKKLKRRPPWIQLNKGTCLPRAIILMPQLPSGSWGKAASDLKSLIDHVADTYHCDYGRISITGHSLGGSGVFDVLLKYPDYFAAAASLSPCSNFKGKLSPIAHIPIWVLHGEKESTYGQYSREIRDQIESYGGICRLTSVAGEGHPIQHCWCDVEYGLFDWLASYSTQNIAIYDSEPYFGDDGIEIEFSSDDNYVMFDEPIDVEYTE